MRRSSTGRCAKGAATWRVDALAPARGFHFEAIGSGIVGDGESVVPMGAETTAGRFTLRAHTPLPARLRLLRDGAEIAATVGTDIEHEIETAGVYRVEAHRRAHGRERTWIVSNPIYLR